MRPGARVVMARSVAVALAIMLPLACASIPSRPRALSETKKYLVSDQGRAAHPGARAGEPIQVLDGQASGLHSYVVPIEADGLVIGYGELPVDGTGFVFKALPVPRASIFRSTREEAVRWATESTAKRGPFHGATVEGPFLVYREPRGYSWAVRFIKGPGQYVVYSGETVIIIARAF